MKTDIIQLSNVFEIQIHKIECRRKMMQFNRISQASLQLKVLGSSWSIFVIGDLEFFVLWIALPASLHTDQGLNKIADILQLIF